MLKKRDIVVIKIITVRRVPLQLKRLYIYDNNLICFLPAKQTLLQSRISYTFRFANLYFVKQAQRYSGIETYKEYNIYYQNNYEPWARYTIMLLLFLACLSAGTKRDIVIVKVITNTMPWGFPPSQSNNKIKKVISYKYNFIFFNPFSSSAYHTFIVQLLYF